jgi:hypothetical protein
LKRIIYLTFNDNPGGIYTSQVIDTCRFLEEEKLASVKLIAFVSLRKFFAFRKIIRGAYSNATVMPMWPGVQNWKKNLPLLSWLIKRTKPEVIIGRGLFATHLALNAASKAKVCFDGRGAYYAEFTEYDVSSGRISSDEIRTLEQRAVQQSDFRIAVSQALVSYWKRSYAYTDTRHVVIPCTLAAHHLHAPASVRSDNEIRIIFSGGTGGWQSLQLLEKMLAPAFRKDERLQLKILAKSLPEDFSMLREFPGRVTTAWLREAEVPAALAQCDYGWLFREQSVTNEVASPVKFAEYLAAGLQVIISPALGDFTAFVQQHQCGMVCEEVITAVPAVSQAQKAANRKLAENYFVKRAYKKAFEELIA